MVESTKFRCFQGRPFANGSKVSCQPEDIRINTSKRFQPLPSFRTKDILDALNREKNLVYALPVAEALRYAQGTQEGFQLAIKNEV